MHVYGEYSHDFEAEIYLGDKKVLEGQPDKEPYPTEFESDSQIQRLFFYDDLVENYQFDIVTINVQKGNLSFGKTLAEYKSVYYDDKGRPIYGQVIKQQPFKDCAINGTLNGNILDDNETWHAKENDTLTFYHLRIPGPDIYYIHDFGSADQQSKYFKSKKYYFNATVNPAMKYIINKERYLGRYPHLVDRARQHFLNRNQQ